jgi:hypothetical protein
MERKQKEFLLCAPTTDANNSIEVIEMNQMKSEDKQSELQVKQKQLDELLAVQRQLEEEKKQSNLAIQA